MYRELKDSPPIHCVVLLVITVIYVLHNEDN